MAQVTPADLFSVQNPVFRSYLFYGSILVIKMMSMSLLTGVQRFKNKAFANPEDAENLKVKPKVDENVERVRRAHRNDLENIPIFFTTAFFYMMTNPSEYMAKTIFFAFTAARITHSIVYAVVIVPQPARALSFAIGMAITGYMAVTALLHLF